MQTNTRSISIFQLIFQSFRIANQTFGSVVLLCLLIFLCGLLCGIIAGGLIFLLGKTPVVMLLQIPLALMNILLGVVFSSALIQIIADRIDGTGFGTFESFKSAFVPSCFFIISSILLFIPFILILLGAACSQSILIVSLVYIALAFGMLPFMFTQHAIVLRATGPIEGLRYSWRVASAHYGTILLTILTVFLLCIFFALVGICIIKVALPQLLQNPAMWQMQLMMSLSSLPLPYVIGGVIFWIILQLYILIAINALITGLFLKLDSLQFMPEELEPVHEVAQPNYSVPQRAKPQVTQKATASNVPTINPDDIFQDVSVTQSSINTQPDDDTIRHLDAVYSAQEHLVQAVEQEEDRMPTILFDEDMARQLQENEQKMKQHQESQARREEEDGQQSIKMSDGQL